MLPMILRLKVREPGRRGFGFWFPVVIVWLLLAVVMIGLLPFMLLAALLSGVWGGPGARLLLVYPLLASLIWNLGGLTIDVNQKGKVLLIDFF